MDVLSGRVLVSSPDPLRAQRFYRDVLGLAVYREFGSPASLVLFAGGMFLEVAGRAGEPSTTSLWLQVRDVRAEHRRLADLGVPVTRAPEVEPWGLVECWITDPDGAPIVLVEIPAGHPLRRDLR